MTASPWLLMAGALCVLLGVVHSALGERLIFQAGEPLPRRYAGIIRASWHALSLFGFAVAVILWRVPLDDVSAGMVIVVLVASALMIASWTRFRHPGWIVMSVIAVLVLMSCI